MGESNVRYYLTPYELEGGRVDGEVIPAGIFLLVTEEEGHQQHLLQGSPWTDMAVRLGRAVTVHPNGASQFYARALKLADGSLRVVIDEGEVEVADPAGSVDQSQVVTCSDRWWVRVRR